MAPRTARAAGAAAAAVLRPARCSRRTCTHAAPPQAAASGASGACIVTAGGAAAPRGLRRGAWERASAGVSGRTKDASSDLFARTPARAPFFFFHNNTSSLPPALRAQGAARGCAALSLQDRRRACAREQARGHCCSPHCLLSRCRSCVLVRAAARSSWARARLQANEHRLRAAAVRVRALGACMCCLHAFISSPVPPGAQHGVHDHVAGGHNRVPFTHTAARTHDHADGAGADDGCVCTRLLCLERTPNPACARLRRSGARQPPA
jgi:hypothetical protein